MTYSIEECALDNLEQLADYYAHNGYTMCIHWIHMQSQEQMKTAQLRIRVEPDLHRAFLEACRAEDLSAAQVLRSFMRTYIEGYEVSRQQDLFAVSSPTAENNSND